jgi:SAM-dependent methyltransferase
MPHIPTLYPHHIDVEPFTEYRDYPVHLERLRWLIKTIDEMRGAGHVRILDVGCGTGNITLPLGLIPNATVVGIDMYQPNIDECNRKNTYPNVTVTFARLNEYPIEDFDVIIFTEVLEHIPGYETLLSDLSKRMKPGAQVLVTIPNGWGPFEWAMTPMYIMRRMGLNGFIGKVKKLLGKKEPYALNQEIDPHVNFFTRKQIQRDCETYHFEMIEFRKSFVMAPIFETYLPFISLRKLAFYDNKLAQVLPTFLASGWYYRIQKVTK